MRGFARRHRVIDEPEQAAAQRAQSGWCSHVGQLRHNSTSHLHQIEASGQARIMPNLQA
jgi:hypothetical protein